MQNPSERFGYDDAMKAADIIRSHVRERGMSDNIKDGVILGSGLGTFVQNYLPGDALRMTFAGIFRDLGIPPAEEKAQGHAHELVLAPLADEKRLVIVQSGREHPYEGVSTRRATFWLRVMQALEAETLVGSNAGGYPDSENPASSLPHAYSQR